MQRDFFEDKPLDFGLVVLDLLVGPSWERMTTREIIRPFRGKGPTYVRIGRHHDFADSTFYEFHITPRVADELVGSGYVRGKPKWGYTDDRELTASDAGRWFLRQERERLGLPDDLRSERWFMGRG